MRDLVTASAVATGVSQMGAVLALWNDIEPSRVAEYERWHALEHAPERVWVPGFTAGTRYVSLDADSTRYFTLYEMDALACLDTPPYEDLVRHPTPWSASMRPSFSNFLRKTCTVLADEGRGVGVGLLAVRVVWDADAKAPGARQAPQATQLEDLAKALLHAGAAACTTRVRIGLQVQAGLQAIANADPAPQGTEYIFILQTASLDSLALLRKIFAEVTSPLMATALWTASSVYQFSSCISHADVQQAQRPLPRLDLMP